MEDMNLNRDGKVKLGVEVRQTQGDVVVHFDQPYHWLGLYPQNAKALADAIFNATEQLLNPARIGPEVYVEVRMRQNKGDVVMQFNEPLQELFLIPMRAYELCESLIMAAEIINNNYRVGDRNIVTLPGEQ